MTQNWLQHSKDDDLRSAKILLVLGDLLLGTLEHREIMLRYAETGPAFSQHPLPLHKDSASLTN